MDDLVARARAHAAEDPDPETRTELEALVARVESGDEAARRDLADRFSAPLEFGTAGLRGRVKNVERTPCAVCRRGRQDVRSRRRGAARSPQSVRSPSSRWRW